MGDIDATFAAQMARQRCLQVGMGMGVGLSVSLEVFEPVFSSAARRPPVPFTGPCPGTARVKLQGAETCDRRPCLAVLRPHHLCWH